MAQFIGTIHCQVFHSVIHGVLKPFALSLAFTYALTFFVVIKKISE